MPKNRKNSADDGWGVPLGADGKVEVAPSKKPNMRDMVSYMRDRTTTANMSINAPVNGPAMMKIFKDMMDKGVTPEQIYRMIDMFAEDIRQTPLGRHEIPWKVFAGRRTNLLKRVDHGVVKGDASEYTFDPRLLKYLGTEESDSGS